MVQGLEAGANDYISKPYDTEKLQARISVGRRIVELQTSLVEARDAVVHQAMYDYLTDIFTGAPFWTSSARNSLGRGGKADGWR